MFLNNKKNKCKHEKQIQGVLSDNSQFPVCTGKLYTVMGGDSAHRSLDCCDLCCSFLWKC